MKKILPLIILLLTATTVFSQVSRNGLLAVYKFDGNFNDSTTNNRHADDSLATFTTDRFNNSNSAASFDGVGGHVKADIGTLVNTTIAFWFKADAQIDPYPHFFDYGDYRYRGMIAAGAIYNSNDRHHIFSVTNFPNEIMTKTSNQVTYDQWTHVAFVFSGDSGKTRIYVNGTLEAETSISNSMNPADNIIMFGRVKSGPVNEINTTNFKGSIDDIYIYNRALSTQEVIDLQNGNFSVGIFESAAAPEIKFYPNPSSNRIFVDAEAIDIVENTNISITDVTGKTVLKTIYSKDGVDVSTLTTGVYFVTIESLNSTVKFVKE